MRNNFVGIIRSILSTFLGKSVLKTRLELRSVEFDIVNSKLSKNCRDLLTNRCLFSRRKNSQTVDRLTVSIAEGLKFWTRVGDERGEVGLDRKVDAKLDDFHASRDKTR